MSETPAKYVADERKYEDKQWLYEQYWGKKKPIPELAEICCVGKRTVAERMEKFGIPRRYPNYNRHNSVSMFAGFYDGDSPTRASSEDIAVEKKTERAKDNSKLNWQKAAKHMDQVGDSAILQ
jgi:hypothetical protein